MKYSHLAPVVEDACGTPALCRHPASDRAWIVTFADLAALMLTFFVMMFAMSGVKSDLWRSTVNSLTQALHLPLWNGLSYQLPAKTVIWRMTPWIPTWTTWGLF